MLDIHPPHEKTRTWADFFIHIATIVVGLLIAIGLEQTVEALHHHHQRQQLESDLREESANNLKNIAHDLQLARFESWYDDAAAAVSVPRNGPIHVTLTPLPCVPGTPSDGTIRTVLPSESVWITARENGMATLIPAERARIYFRRSILFELVSRYLDKLFDNCLPLNAMQRRLAQRSTDGRTYDWTLTPSQAEEFAAHAAQQAATLKAICFRLRYLAAFEQDLLDGGHRINGAPLDSTYTDLLDPEDLPQPR